MKKAKKWILCVLAALGVFTAGAISMKNDEMQNLQELIQTDVGDASLYTPLSFQSYSDSLEAAIIITDHFFPDSGDINDAYAGLQDSIDQLQLIPDKTELQNLYDQSAAINQSNYIPSTTELLQNEITHAASVLNDPNAVSDDVDAACARLSQAMNSLIEKPDKTELRAVLNAASLFEESQYLPSSFQALRTAIDTGFSVLENENAVDDDVNRATLTLNQRIDTLIPKPDKTALKELIDVANSSSEEKYTTVSYASLKQATTSAARIFHDENATQEQVSNAESQLSKALDGLAVSTRGIYKIQVSFSRESNNHVGNSWYYGAFYNNADIDGETITARHGSSISIYCKVVEDDSIPDIGSDYLTVRMQDGNTNSISISVYENRGRYSGNRAVWSVRATVTPVERI